MAALTFAEWKLLRELYVHTYWIPAPPPSGWPWLPQPDNGVIKPEDNKSAITPEQLARGVQRYDENTKAGEALGRIMPHE